MFLIGYVNEFFQGNSYELAKIIVQIFSLHLFCSQTEIYTEMVGSVCGPFA